jgi:hypothetical protein
LSGDFSGPVVVTEQFPPYSVLVDFYLAANATGGTGAFGGITGSFGIHIRLIPRTGMADGEVTAIPPTVPLPPQ